MNRKIGERKHIVYQVSALFKFYERTFLTLDIDWIESHSHSAKILKSESNSENFSNGYLKSNFVLREHLDCDMDHETKIKVFSTQSINNRLTLYSLNLLPNGHFLSCELASAVLPFSLSGRGQYKSVLRMMSIFHDEIIKQEILFEEINQTVTHSKKLTVRQALKIPKTMVD
uniref:Uncharacterized protein n=1 Tax=Rhizophagus irregularis (strain DAOM 181602 / DAOM 197198 / MUCL 43194) TaxID=747089 RepID=U9UQR7_RHIID